LIGWYVSLDIWKLEDWKLSRATETERRDTKQTKGTAATPANPALLPLVASLVFKS